MAEEKFISKYTANEIESMLDKVKTDMQIIQYTQSEINTLLGKIQNGGGHTIIDGNDTQLNQETNLKFSKDFDVSDDSTNHNTEVEQHEISSSEWDEIMATVPSPGATVTPAGFTPVGTIISVMGTTAPQNYLACDGTVYNISQYQVLANYIKDQFGSYNKFGGDGTTTFAVPDLRGEFLRGTGTNSHANQGSGAAVGVHQDGTVVDLPLGYNNTTIGVLSSNVGKGFYNSSELNLDSISTSSGHMLAVSANKYGPYNDLSSYTSRPTNTSVLYCIATKNVYIDARFDYSLDEKVVGTWIDGKPIYQKTYIISISSGDNKVPINISNINEIVKIDAITYGSSRAIPIPSVYTSDTVSSNTWYCGITVTNKSTIFIESGCEFASANPNVYATLQYTKTTD